MIGKNYKNAIGTKVTQRTASEVTTLAKPRWSGAVRVLGMSSLLILGACSGGGGMDGTAGSAMSAKATVASVAGLPVAVVGAAGTTATVTFNASAGNWAQRLSLQVTNRNASVRFNNGAWVDLGSTAVSVDSTSNGVTTVSFPVAGNAGTNTVDFRLNTANTAATGFQVPAISLLDQSGKQLADTTTFVEAPIISAAASPTPLPLDVVGVAGSTLTTTFNLAAGNWMKTVSLQVNNRNASVQLNNGTWVDLSGTGVTVAGTSNGITTLTLPVSNGIPGSNTLRFRLNATNTAQTPFRVSTIGLLDPSGKQLIDASAFVQSTAATSTISGTSTTSGTSSTSTTASGSSASASSTVASTSSTTTSSTSTGTTSNTTTSTPLTVTMPLEVMGDPGTTVTATVSAPTGNAATVLYMQANNLSYDNKVSVQINGGNWINLANASVTVLGAGKAYGGIGGGFDTIKLTVPITGGVAGKNTVAFRFNGTDGVSSGFRVLAFDLQDATGKSLTAAGTFVQDDPTKWSAPSVNTADIAAGKTLWQTATLAGAPGKANIKAHCMDCHSASGYDLHRFNYSNYSIIARSKFHGLSATQGAQIASFIRSLTAQFGTPGANCRPWNPPYQPGPGLDAGDVKNWTCGAGLQAISENDLDTLNTVFPSGAAASTISTKGNVNARQIPISLQLPDWNHWMPRIHPIDAWGSYFTSSNLLKVYNGTGTGSETYNITDKLANGGASYVTNPNSTFQNDLYYWGVYYGEQFNPPNKGTPYQYTVQQQEAIYGTVLWQLSKLWEVTQQNNLESLCPQLYANKGAPKVEARSWCGNWRFAFDVSPHIQKFPPDSSMFGSRVGHYMKANQWYEMQLLLNPGSGQHNDHLPLDWQYAYGVMDDLSSASGRNEPARNFVYVLKGAQAMDNGIGPDHVDQGWTIRDSSPLDVWKSGQSGIWKGVPAATEQRVVNAFLSNWTDTTTSFNLSTWQRAGQANANNDAECGWSMRELCNIGYVPESVVGGTNQNFPTWSHEQIPQMRSEGIDRTQLNRFAGWLNSAYPAGGFQALVQ